MVVDRVKDNWYMSRSIENIHCIRDTDNNQCNEEDYKNESSVALCINSFNSDSPFDDLQAEHMYSISRIHNHFPPSTIIVSQRVGSPYDHSVIDQYRRLLHTDTGNLG